MKQKFSMMHRLTVVIVLSGWLAAAAGADSETQALREALAKGGHIALMRHTLAPGTGDPPGFRLEDCTTQRNLSEEGREQARRIGRRFREQQVEVARVLSSRWCRCLETARLLALAPVEPFPVLDSFFRRRQRGPEQTAALERFIADWEGGAALVLVTHQVNITALTGVFPRSGEIVVIRPREGDEIEVVGRIPPP